MGTASSPRVAPGPLDGLDPALSRRSRRNCPHRKRRLSARPGAESPESPRKACAGTGGTAPQLPCRSAHMTGRGVHSTISSSASSLARSPRCSRSSTAIRSRQAPPGGEPDRRRIDGDVLVDQVEEVEESERRQQGDEVDRVRGTALHHQGRRMAAAEQRRGAVLGGTGEQCLGEQVLLGEQGVEAPGRLRESRCLGRGPGPLVEHPHGLLPGGRAPAHEVDDEQAHPERRGPQAAEVGGHAPAGRGGQGAHLHADVADLRRRGVR